mgnify:CR=1 FL=1
MVDVIVCFLTCGYTEAGAMQFFLKKINDRYEYRQCLPNKTIKKNHIVRAKSVAYIIDAKPQVEYNTEELQKIVYMIFPRRQRRECMRTRSVIITRII